VIEQAGLSSGATPEKSQIGVTLWGELRSRAELNRADSPLEPDRRFSSGEGRLAETDEQR
jgi:hypothetical protein